MHCKLILPSFEPAWELAITIHAKRQFKPDVLKLFPGLRLLVVRGNPPLLAVR